LTWRQFLRVRAKGVLAVDFFTVEQMRSCSSSVVFMDESAEQIASVDPRWPSVADDPQTGGGIRRFQSERPLWTMGVVVGGIHLEDLFQVAASDDQQPVQALSADVRLHRSA
jgi:hypothetical protein